MSTLRSLAETQEMFRENVCVDTDADGEGEYGFFGELAGGTPVRVLDPATGVPAKGGPMDTLDPPLLPDAFKDLVADRNMHGVVQRGGYCFKIYLARSLPEASAGGARSVNLGEAWDSAGCEESWCAYAWPIDVGEHGTRAFFKSVDQPLLQHLNEDARYDGLGKAPSWDAFSTDGWNAVGR